MSDQGIGLTPAEQNQLIYLLGRLQQPWPREVYNAFASIICFTAIEVALLRMHEGRLQILLTERTGDEFYAGKFHSPGSMLRATDVVKTDGLDPSACTYENAIKRVLVQDLGFPEMMVEEDWTMYFNSLPLAIPGFPYNTPRGPENCLLIIGELAEVPAQGAYVDIEKVLNNPVDFFMIPHNLLVIRRAKWAFNLLYQLRNIEGW